MGGTVGVAVEINVGGGMLRTRVPVPAGEVESAELMPVFRSLSDAVVRLSVMGVEKAGKKVSCHDGCAACCRHLVPLSVTEALALVAMIEAMPAERRTRVKDRFAVAAAALRAAGLADALLDPRTVDADRQLELGVEYYRLYLDCPFLENERCTVYEERPIVCREFLMTSPAENCRPLRDPLERVPIAANTNRALLWMFERPGTTQAPWVALAMLMEWAERSPARPERRTGPEHVGRFVGCMNEAR